MGDVEKVSRYMQQLAVVIDGHLEELSSTGERIPFTLIVYTPGRASYVGTCDRADAIREMKRLIELWENGMPDIPAHEVI